MKIELTIGELCDIVKDALLDLCLCTCDRCGREWHLWNYLTPEDIEEWLKKRISQWSSTYL